MDVATSTAAALAKAVATGQASARELAEAALALIAQRDGPIRAMTDVTAKRARAEADAVDAARRKGAALGPLAGVPYVVKNLADIAGLPTRAGSKINRDTPPAARDATVVTRLKAAGATLVGAANMGEYAYDFTGRNAHDGHVGNPNDPARLSGGSSSGSAAAVAAGYCPIAIGSDTNGSIRVPAALCGILGLKPTFGRVSRAGTFPFVASLDHIGPFARTVEDLALAYEAIAGPDPADPVASSRPVDTVHGLLCKGAEGLRVAVAGGYFTEKRSAEVADAVALVASALGARKEVVLPEVARARAAAFIITTAEGGQLHLERLRSRALDFDPETRDRLIAGAMTPAAWVIASQRFRRWFQRETLKLFETTDLILAPSTPVSAPLIDELTVQAGGETLWVRGMLGLFTQPFSFIGLPVISVPVVRPGRMPVGVQLVAAPWREDVAFRAAAALESRGVAVSMTPKPSR